MDRSKPGGFSAPKVTPEARPSETLPISQCKSLLMTDRPERGLRFANKAPPRGFQECPTQSQLLVWFDQKIHNEFKVLVTNGFQGPFM